MKVGDSAAVRGHSPGRSGSGTFRPARWAKRIAKPNPNPRLNLPRPVRSRSNARSSGACSRGRAGLGGGAVFDPQPRGVRPARDRSGEQIIDYVGEIVTKDESDRRGDIASARALRTGGGSVYLFTLNKKFDIDGAFPWNPARLINHSCDPNCEVHIVKGQIWILALKDIAAGEELSFNYGFDLEDFESHPCRCGAERCAGFIVAEEFWPELDTLLQQNGDR